MKRKWIVIYFLLLFLPYVAVLVLGKAGFFEQKKQPSPEPQGYTVTLFRHESATTECLPLRDYLWGVLAGEMPASYPEEALKAQVVASYSYLLHRKETMGMHPDSDFGHTGDVCDDPNHCKAYLPPPEAIRRWGQDWYDASEKKLSDAIESVLGEALLYERTAANTVFHSISGGRTEDAKDVWGAEIPYLKSVDSGWDRTAKGFSSTLTVPIEEFCEKLELRDCTPGAVTLTEGGSVATIVLGDKTFTGRQLRTLFSLRSTRFTLNIDEKEATFQVAGYGHQVGLSQYGASVLAEKGYNYREILAYYYSGTTLTQNYYPSSV